MREKKYYYFSTFFVLGFCISAIFLWFSTRALMPAWANVPPAPQAEKASLLTLGDQQLAYRYNAFLLQNMGYGLATDRSLSDYDYGRLKEWFFLQDNLDSISDVTPMLAAYYYGAVQDSEKMQYVVDYLAHAGKNPIKEKWRWLARAVFLARYEMQDIDKALDLSYLLAKNKNPNLADWAVQMPAFILAEQGQSEAAYQIMANILESRYDKLHPNEVNFMRDYMCNTLLPKIQTKPRPLFCNSVKN